VDPANYLMFKWYTDETEIDSPLAFGHFKIFYDPENSEVRAAFARV